MAPTFGPTSVGRQEAAAPPVPAGVPAHLADSRWLPWLVGLTITAATLGLRAALLDQEQVQFARATALQLESVRNEIAVRMESRMLAQSRMARRWELRGRPPRAEWEADATQYVRHYAGLVSFAWVDATYRAQWQIQAPGAVSLAALAPGAQRAWRAAREGERITFTPALRERAGEPVFLVNAPIFAQDGFGGLIVAVHGVRALLDDILREHIAPGYGVRVLERDATLYRRGPDAGEEAPALAQETAVRLADADWRVRVWPHAGTLAEMRSQLPLAVLAGGLTLALLLALAVRLAQVARTRALEAESTNRELQREVLERHRAQGALRKLSRAVEQSPSMVLITDTAGAIEYVNPRFAQVSGYSLEDLRGGNPRILKSGLTPPETYAQLWTTIRSGAEWRGELCNRKRSGETYWEHIAISPIRDERGTITHFLAEAEDVTERKRLQEEIAARNRERAENQALAAMGQAATMIAHDLRNPLSTIKMSLGILAKHAGSPLTEAEHEINHIALEQVRYMEEVLSDLLLYSRPDALQPSWLDLGKLLDASVALGQREIEEREVRVETRHEPGLPTLHGDANKLRQAFSNLILNAVQATEGRGDAIARVSVCASIQLETQSPELRIEIADNGCGIPAELAERVFEPFFTSRARGTGLGLPIAKRIIEQHRGRLELRPGPQGGTRAVVALPVGPVREAS